MQMGGAQDYGYISNPYAAMYQQNVDDLKQKGNVENAFANGLNQVGLAFEDAFKKTANIVAPGSGAIVGMAMDAQRPKSLTDPTSKGMSGEGMASMLKGVISDPEALTGFLARYGGSMRKFQTAGQNSVPGFTSDMIVDPWNMLSATGTPTSGEKILSNYNTQNYLNSVPLMWNAADESQNTPALTATPDNLFCSLKIFINS
jgi:hypothetical protein